MTHYLIDQLEEYTPEIGIHHQLWVDDTCLMDGVSYSVAHEYVVERIRPGDVYEATYPNHPATVLNYEELMAQERESDEE